MDMISRHVPFLLSKTKMITEYRSNLINYSTFVLFKGRVVCVRFDNQGSYSNFKSSNEELCKEIEKLPGFNTTFYLYKQEKPVEKSQEAVAVSTATPYPKVKKIQEAIAVLESEFGVDGASIVSKSDALRYASQHNISFPNLK